MQVDKIEAVVISSEPLTYLHSFVFTVVALILFTFDVSQWRRVNVNHMLVVVPLKDGGKHLANVAIHIGSCVDRCFQKWKNFALQGKTFKVSLLLWLLITELHLY